MRDLFHLLHEEDEREGQAKPHGDGEVKGDCHCEGHEQDEVIPFGTARQFLEIQPFAHAEGHHEQHGGKRGQREILRKRSGDENDPQERDGVNDPRDRRAAAAADVGRGAGDGSRGGDAAEERADEICDALAHEFLIGIVARLDHPVGDHRGEEGFDRPK